MAKILITGGAGYIGSITNQELKKAGFETVIFDSFRHAHEWAISGTKLIKGNLLNYESIKEALKTEKPDGVIHFAAFIEAGESMQNPAKYFENNCVGSLNLLKAMQETNINNLVFSSTAAVYGTPKTSLPAGRQVPIKEDFEKNPTNAYGETKLVVERMIKWFNQLHGLNFVALRYFNASGAALDGSLGEAHDPESHIIPIFIKRILKGESFSINGNDYHTPDGTCVRDYIHILDLASAHILALKALLNNQSDKINTAYNVGTGKGYSNKEIADTIIKITGTDQTYSWGPRRSGDPDELVADSTKLQNALGWKPKHSDLETIIKSAWRWHQNNTPGRCI